MKKILPVLILLTLLLLPGITIAVKQYEPPEEIEAAVTKVVNAIFTVLVIISVILFIWGGATIVSAGGDVEKVNHGRSIILYAVIGLIVAFLSKAFHALIKLYL